MQLHHVDLDDKYTKNSGHIYINGLQALVRLCFLQHNWDQQHGLNTACFVSGYRGSPLGGLDKTFWDAKKFLEPHRVTFKPGINEDLAATAVWGSQQANLFQGARVDGVFGMWYGKGPGVDRSGDVFKHANLAGTSKNGGVLLLMGDDHACKSSTAPHQSEFAMMDASIPVLNPMNVQEIIDLGLYGWALSRFSGCWVGFKVISETADSSAIIDINLKRFDPMFPSDILPKDGLHIRWPDPPMDQERRLHEYKLKAAQAFVSANRLDRVIVSSKNPRLGIITTGKSTADVLQALEDLGLDQQAIDRFGIGVYKVAMTWPLEPQGIINFASRYQELWVIEEKRAFLEPQIKDILYHLPADSRPKIYGKYDENGTWLFPSTGELNPSIIAKAIYEKTQNQWSSETAQQRYSTIIESLKHPPQRLTEAERIPYYCSGCPHNTSTRVPEGSRALAGIGCHYMATWIDPQTQTFAQMGGEGVPWIGQAEFTETNHVFANLGDGTYFHSGILAIRAAISAKVNITYKILYNDAVAMTGGQHVDGELSVAQITHQLYAEGVRTMAVVSDHPEHHQTSDFAPDTRVFHRSMLDQIQRQYRDIPGVSVIIYEQTCAAEKRRRRKRNLMEDPPRRIFINADVCEGCGDCSVKSNCLSVVPLETEMGRKRTIDQSSCNKDYSCINGFCPSFVLVDDAKLKKKSRPVSDHRHSLPPPPVLSLEKPYNIFITGVGGTGVVTTGALLVMAAHLEGLGATALDMTGLAQKGGAVTSFVRIASKPEDIHTVRISSGNTDVLLGCDLLVSAMPEILEKLSHTRSRAVVNSSIPITGAFTHHPDWNPPVETLKTLLQQRTMTELTQFIPAGDLAQHNMGDTLATNMVILGFAFQKGWIPISIKAFEEAIRINGAAIDLNLYAFSFGRQVATEGEKFIRQHLPKPFVKLDDFESIVQHRTEFLTAYHHRRYAHQYKKWVESIESREKAIMGQSGDLSKAVARYLAKLMSFKDEFEVARLYTRPEFQTRLADQFEEGFKIKFHMAPPLFAKRNAQTGELEKREFGSWMKFAFRVLRHLKWLRFTPLNIFGYTQERKMERKLIRQYREMIEMTVDKLSKENYKVAVELAEIPEHIRGFGHIKEKSIEKAQKHQRDLIKQLG